MISVVVPAYNEARVLDASLRRIVDFLARRGEPFEVVVVDDGSADATAGIAEAAARADGRVRLIRHGRNRGKGAAVRTGVLAARGEATFFLDADLSTPIEELDRFLPALRDGTDVVLASRRIEGARLGRRQGRIRESLGKVFTALARFLAAPGVRDFTCGFKGFSRAGRDQIFSVQTIDRWAFDAEIVAIARRRGLRIVEIPVVWHDEPDSKVRVLRDGFRSFLELLRIAWRRGTGRYDR